MCQYYHDIYRCLCRSPSYAEEQCKISRDLSSTNPTSEPFCTRDPIRQTLGRHDRHYCCSSHCCESNIMEMLHKGGETVERVGAREILHAQRNAFDRTSLKGKARAEHQGCTPYQRDDPRQEIMQWRAETGRRPTPPPLLPPAGNVGTQAGSSAAGSGRETPAGAGRASSVTGAGQGMSVTAATQGTLATGVGRGGHVGRGGRRARQLNALSLHAKSTFHEQAHHSPDRINHDAASLPMAKPNWPLAYGSSPLYQPLLHGLVESFCAQSRRSNCAYDEIFLLR